MVQISWLNISMVVVSVSIDKIIAIQRGAQMCKAVPLMLASFPTIPSTAHTP